MNNFEKITAEHVTPLMVIENACHSHPWTEKTFRSCIDGRYFGEFFQNISQASTPENSQIIGFYIADYVAGESTLMDICVPPDLQGQGIGKKLLKQFLDQAKQRGAQKVYLEVRAKNIAAQMLYMNHGFIETGRRTGYYPSANGFGYEDAIVMSAKL